MPNILFFDTETTGLPSNYRAPASDLDNWPRMVQFAWLVTDENGREIKSTEYIIKPQGFTIPTGASNIHGITTEMATKYGANLSLVLDEFLDDFNQASLLIAHNIAFDEKVVAAEYLRVAQYNPLEGIQQVCTMVSATDFCAIRTGNRYKWPKLQELHVKLFNRRFEEAHNAISDVKACARCYFELVARGILPKPTNLKDKKKNVSTHTKPRLSKAEINIQSQKCAQKFFRNNPRLFLALLTKHPNGLHTPAVSSELYNINQACEILIKDHLLSQWLNKDIGTKRTELIEKLIEHTSIYWDHSHPIPDEPLTSKYKPKYFANYLEKTQNEWNASYIEKHSDQLNWNALSYIANIEWTPQLIVKYEKLLNFNLLSSNYRLPWSSELIERYADRWDWHKLSENESLPWSSELIERYADRWDWHELSGNESLLWSSEVIDRYADRWDWHELSENESLPWSSELIERYADRWDWRSLSSNEDIKWSTKTLITFRERIDWNYFQLERTTPLTTELIDQIIDNYKVRAVDSEALSTALIEKHADKLNWYDLSNLKKNWPIEFIERHKNKWNWHALCANPEIIFDAYVIDRFKNYLDWSELSSSVTIPWSTTLIDEFRFKWDWEKLSENPSLPWSEDLVSRFEDNWHWSVLSANPNLPWSEGFILKYQDYWFWDVLSSNYGLPLTDKFIQEFDDRWDFYRLVNNDGLSPTINFIKKYKDKFLYFDASLNFWTKFSRSLSNIQHINDPYIHTLCSFLISNGMFSHKIPSVDLIDSQKLEFVNGRVSIHGVYNVDPVYECDGYDELSCFNLSKKQFDTLVNHALFEISNPESNHFLLSLKNSEPKNPEVSSFADLAHTLKQN